MSEEKCACWWNVETGAFEACCEKHEQDYVDYLEQLAQDKSGRFVQPHYAGKPL